MSTLSGMGAACVLKYSSYSSYSSYSCTSVVGLDYISHRGRNAQSLNYLFAASSLYFPLPK